MGITSRVSFTLAVLPLALRSTRNKGHGVWLDPGDSALGLAALHHALEKRPFAEVIQLLKFRKYVTERSAFT
jgi:hypothetical protein